MKPKKAALSLIEYDLWYTQAQEKEAILSHDCEDKRIIGADRTVIDFFVIGSMGL